MKGVGSEDSYARKINRGYLPGHGTKTTASGHRRHVVVRSERPQVT